jgi:Protein of unknown function (DUF2637)
VSRADKWTRGVTIAVVVVVGVVAGYVSYRHIRDLALTHGEDRPTAWALPVTVDGPMLAASLVLLDAARRRLPTHLWAWVTLVLGILASGTANVLHGIHHGIVGAVLSAWPAAMLVLSVELLLRLFRAPAEQTHATAEQARTLDPELAAKAAALFADAETVPSQRAIRTRMRLGQARAKAVQDYLAARPSLVADAA